MIRKNKYDIEVKTIDVNRMAGISEQFKGESTRLLSIDGYGYRKLPWTHINGTIDMATKINIYPDISTWDDFNTIKKENKMKRFFRKIRENAEKLEIMWKAMKSMQLISMNLFGEYIAGGNIMGAISNLESQVAHLMKDYHKDYFAGQKCSVDTPNLDMHEGRIHVKHMVKIQYVCQQIMDINHIIKARQVETAYTSKRNAKEHAVTIARFKREVTEFNKQKQENK